MELFICNPAQNRITNLIPDDAKHCVKVKRHKVDDYIYCIDGQGFMYNAKILSLKGNLELEIVESFKNWGEPVQKRHIVISPLRNKNRLEWFLEKAVELGASEISFIETERTVKPSVNLDRMERIVQAASKQSMRSKFLKLNALQYFDDFLKENSFENAYIAHMEAKILANEYSSQIQSASKTIIFIGPEGDFTKKEIELAKSKNIQEIHFGEGRLRAETAGIYGLSFVKFLQKS